MVKNHIRFGGSRLPPNNTLGLSKRDPEVNYDLQGQREFHDCMFNSHAVGASAWSPYFMAAYTAFHNSKIPHYL